MNGWTRRSNVSMLTPRAAAASLRLSEYRGTESSGLRAAVACEHVFVTSQGSAHARFRRALATRNPLLVRVAAAELGSISLADALSILPGALARRAESVRASGCALSRAARFRRSLVWNSRTHRSCWRRFRVRAGLTPPAPALRWPSSSLRSSLPTCNNAWRRGCACRSRPDASQLPESRLHRSCLAGATRTRWSGASSASRRSRSSSNSAPRGGSA
jgi:hypothetical protein